MNAWHPFSSGINLHVSGRVSLDDARRQEATAREILQRLADRPGLVLADEVGMGKTFVGLAVATSVALSDPERRPVVVMVPPSLKEKWPRDFAVFREKCLDPELADRVDSASAETAVAFLKLLDDPEERRKSIIFLTHGAMHRGLTDRWVKLAMIQRALHRRHHTQALRRALHRCAGKLLQLGWVESQTQDIWQKLLSSPTEAWLGILLRHGIDPEGDDDAGTDDDPVPQVVADVLRSFDATAVYEALQDIPRRRSANYDQRVTQARRVLTAALKEVWGQCLKRVDFRLPLLVMDEAHHLKNPGTRLSGLFQVPDAEGDAEEVSRGALGGVFERMLFLTATPFQLGHHELCSVLERFDGVRGVAPPCGRDSFQQQVRNVRERLDAAQEAALSLDAVWGRLRTDDLIVNRGNDSDLEAWWQEVKAGTHQTPACQSVLACYQRTIEKMRLAEEALRPWMIRHLKPRALSGDFVGRPRRQRLPGKAILSDRSGESEAGLEVSSEALLPFLLAARATVCAPESRPVFAEGLASSYEAFRHTRRSREYTTDTDDELSQREPGNAVGEWYLEQLERALPRDDVRASASHPKVSATAQCVLAAWKGGEKAVVFCHYVATGRVLRRVLSDQIRGEIARLGAEKLKCTPNEAEEHLERLGDRFFDTDSPARRACDAQVGAILKEYRGLFPHVELIRETVRRYLRTPSFLVRYFPLDQDGLDDVAVEMAFHASDESGLDLLTVLREFLDFLETRCVEDERQIYLDAVQRTQTGGMRGREALGSFTEDEIQEGNPALLLPNVRLVNGATRQETRQRLMLTFNSPFFPEVLVASSVMSEGVDLHRFCRYVIHHDLCWNPSTLEQRTGRVDRIGAKVESCGDPIQVYLPFLTETQDEKMYRVVMDRERWFSVVMGEKFKVDALATEKLAQRVPLPASVARSLAFRLEVRGEESSNAPARATEGRG